MIDHIFYMELTQDKIMVDRIVNTGVLLRVKTMNFEAIIRCILNVKVVERKKDANVSQPHLQMK